MLFIFATTILFFVLFCGLGRVLLLITHWNARNNPAIVPFLGIGGACLYFSWVSLFLPLTIWTFAPLACAGAAGLVVLIKNNTKNQLAWRLVAAGVVAAVIISYIYYNEGDGVLESDTYLYHASLVTWMNTTKVVPGLANLHFRLGMNSAYLILAAGIDVGGFDKYSSYILPAVFSLAYILYFGYEIVRGRREEKAFAIVMVAWVFLCNEWLPSLYYDVPSMMFLSLAYYEVLRRWTKQENLSSRGLELLFATLSFCIKQMGAVLLLIVFIYHLIDMQKEKALNLKAFAALVAIPALFAVSYVARNLIQTGWPLYPLPVARFSFKWTCPPKIINGCYDAIRYWARWPMAGYMSTKGSPFMYWFAPWIKRALLCNDSIYPATLVASFGLAFFVAGRLFKKTWRAAIISTVPILVIFANGIFWFISAPDFRFGSVLFFMLLASLLYFCDFGGKTYCAVLFAVVGFVLTAGANALQLQNGITPHKWFQENYHILFAVAMMYLSAVAAVLPPTKGGHSPLFVPAVSLVALCVLVSIYHNRGDTDEVAAALTHPLPPPVAACPVRVRRLHNGQTPPFCVFIPTKSDRCGDAPLPCTPYPNDALLCLDPRDFTKGFWFAQKD